MKNQFLSIVCGITAFLITTTSLMAQDTIQVVTRLQPFRIGVKIGFPNAIGGHVEYVTPLLHKRLAPSIEYTSLNLDNYLDGDLARVKYFEAGLNYYFGKRRGRGSYVHLGYGKFKAEYVGEGYNTNMAGQEGTGTFEIDHGSINIRLGAKAGGLFYFRPEIGYMFSPFPNTLDVEINYPDGSREVESEEIPGIVWSGLTFNFGIGFAF